VCPTSARILLVDDKPQELRALESVLTSPYYCLVKARSGEESLRAFLSSEFAPVLLHVTDTGAAEQFPKCLCKGNDLINKTIVKSNKPGLPSLDVWFWESGFDRDPIEEVEWMRNHVARTCSMTGKLGRNRNVMGWHHYLRGGTRAIDESDAVRPGPVIEGAAGLIGFDADESVCRIRSVSRTAHDREPEERLRAILGSHGHVAARDSNFRYRAFWMIDHSRGRAAPTGKLLPRRCL
jgi:hypothetical protein